MPDDLGEITYRRFYRSLGVDLPPDAWAQLLAVERTAWRDAALEAGREHERRVHAVMTRGR